jgi:1,4-alpha-glucan branching enzyme
VIAWIRSAEDQTEHVLVVSNLTPVVRHDYRIGVPAAGRYIEILNSDDRRYGGSGVSNAEMTAAEAKPAHGCEMSIALSLPPLATVFLQHRSDASNI